MPGYKQTEVGVIPEDWEVKNLSAVCSEPIQNGIFFEPSRKGKGIKLINVGDLYIRSPISTDSLQLFDANESERLRFRVVSGDLFFTRSSIVPSGIAHCNIYVSEETEPVVFDSHIIRLRPDSKKVVPSYLFRFCNSDAARAYLISHAKTAIMTTIDQSVLNNCPVILPLRNEQQRIAEALSDADELIEGLGQLISKKLELKQGAMQELLSGRKRLSQESVGTFKNSEIGEIPSDWHVAEVGNIANVKTGPFGSSLHEHDYVEDGTPIVTVEHLGKRGITYSNLPKVSEKDWKRLSAYSLQEGDIVFSRVGSIDRNAFVSKAEQGWLFSGRLLRVRRLSSKTDTKYLSYYFHSEPFKNRVRTVAVGQTMASLNTQILKSVLVALPPHAEQTAIATILSDMDAEIAGLEVKLGKARRVKEGMMQDLLTGKVRLV